MAARKDKDKGGVIPFRQRSLLYKVLVVSLLFHVALVILASPLVLYSYLFRREVSFEAPADRERRIEPRKLEYKVRVKEQQKKSGRPRVQPRLTAARVSELSLPDIKLEVAPITHKALPQMRNFSLSGVGKGLGDGEGDSGLSMGQSSVNFFGIRAEGERIFFLVDVSESMLEDERGGQEGFKAVKDDISGMLNRLSPGTFFNVLTFAHTVDVFRDKMLLAGDDNKRAAIAWLQPYNEGANIRTRSSNDKPIFEIDGIPQAESGVTRHDLALNHAFAQGADTVFMITDGEPRLIKKLTEKEWDDWKRRYWTDAAVAKVKREREAYDKALAAENERRAKRGLAPKRLEYGLPELPYPEMSPNEVIAYLDALQKACYLDKGAKPARVYIVGYETTPDSETLLREISRKNSGRFRHLKNLAKGKRR